MELFGSKPPRPSLQQSSELLKPQRHYRNALLREMVPKPVHRALIKGGRDKEPEGLHVVRNSSGEALNVAGDGLRFSKVLAFPL